MLYSQDRNVGAGGLTEGAAIAERREMILAMTLSDIKLFSHTNCSTGWLRACICVCVLAQSSPIIDGPNKRRPEVRH